MERPYHGLVWREKRQKPRAPRPADESDLVTVDSEDAPEPYERAYPDGSVPAECWPDGLNDETRGD